MPLSATLHRQAQLRERLARRIAEGLQNPKYPCNPNGSPAKSCTASGRIAAGTLAVSAIPYAANRYWLIASTTRYSRPAVSSNRNCCIRRSAIPNTFTISARRSTSPPPNTRNRSRSTGNEASNPRTHPGVRNRVQSS
jgi:hypothetical protein